MKIYKKKHNNEIRFVTSKNILHNINDQPAIIYANGSQIWYKNGNLHREGDKPAVIYANGDQYWYKNGKLHREGDKPAIIRKDGYKAWYKNGNLHRDNDLPAIIYANGSQFWYKDGKRHREGDQPAIILANGSQYWYKDGKQHREGDKPAVIYADGTKRYFKYDVEFSPNIIGYHLRDIKINGKYGSLDKIKEELDELEESIEQNNKILTLIELSDLYGAINGFLKNEFPNISMEDIKNMSESTERAFKNGIRKSKD